jgi:hypothetical protein
MTGLSQWGYILAAAVTTGIICSSLACLAQRQGRDLLAAILAAVAILSSILCVVMVIWQ